MDTCRLRKIQRTQAASIAVADSARIAVQNFHDGHVNTRYGYAPLTYGVLPIAGTCRDAKR